MLLNLINLASKGRSHMLLSHIPNAKNKEDSKELSKNEEEKLSTYKDQISELKSEIQLLKNELEDKDKESNQQDKYAKLLNNIFHKGIIDEDGNFLNQYE